MEQVRVVVGPAGGQAAGVGLQEHLRHTQGSAQGQRLQTLHPGELGV